ncbi:MAG: AbrB/MazE/SpoVT family DNA-binding domain-containing protein [Candidatus Magnetoovum sp. WYHC-5]|nr:AbrB/MazE/SpoVT family DNA-binding domain-containing protein [Candidatus Magnetoovum sp. WYHC-5]
MKAITVSSEGQIAIPKEIRERLGIKTGDHLNIHVIEDKIILKPVGYVPKSQEWFWSEEVQDIIKATEVDFKEGKSITYNIDDFLKELDVRDSSSS